jgi:hypothetical protein
MNVSIWFKWRNLTAGDQPINERIAVIITDDVSELPEVARSRPSNARMEAGGWYEDAEGPLDRLGKFRTALRMAITSKYWN